MERIRFHTQTENELEKAIGSNGEGWRFATRIQHLARRAYTSVPFLLHPARRNSEETETSKKAGERKILSPGKGGRLLGWRLIGPFQPSHEVRVTVGFAFLRTPRFCVAARVHIPTVYPFPLFYIPHNEI